LSAVLIHAITMEKK